MKTQYNDEKTKAIYLVALEKTKKLKTKISNLECKYLEEAIVVMNLLSALKEDTYKNVSEYNAKKEIASNAKHDLYNFENEIYQLKIELQENNNLLMRTCIASEDKLKNCINGDWTKIKEGYEEFRILTNAIKDIEGVS